jgi:5-bromo-4-chloroindolyl phosphate hydrolysis protein
MGLFKDTRARERIEELRSNCESSFETAKGDMMIVKNRIEMIEAWESTRKKPYPTEEVVNELKELRIYCDNLLHRIESIEANYQHYTLNRFDVLEQKIDQIKKKLEG